MPKTKLVIGATLATMIAASTVYAGWKDTTTLYFQMNPDGSGDAFAEMGNVRNSTTNGNSEAGCAVNGYTSYQTATCYIYDTTTSTYRTCSTGSASMINTISAITSDSSIYFEWDVVGECTFISIGPASSYAPKSP